MLIEGNACDTMKIKRANIGILLTWERGNAEKPAKKVQDGA